MAMTFRKILGRMSAASVLPLAMMLFTAMPAHAQDMARTPGLLSQAESVTPESPSKVMDATVWLNLHNRQQLDEAVAQIYAEGSPAFHHWMTPAQLAKYQPTAAELAAVRKELAAQGLRVVATDRNNTYVKVRGTVGTLQAAFSTRINSYMLKGQRITATESEPRLGGAAGSFVSHVSVGGPRSGPAYARPFNPATRKPFPAVPISNPNGFVFASNCFLPPQSVVFRTTGAKLPVGTYYGNTYGANPNNTRPGTLAPCGYSPFELESAYGLNPAYGQGLTGKGQTIVIVDAFGSPTIATDANAFNSLTHLPRLTSSNFHIYYPEGAPPVGDAGWALETTLDVEWAHAAAPGANIALVIAPTNYDNDLQTAVFYALANGLGNVISNSYSGAEVLDIQQYPQSLTIWNQVTQLAAALGVSANFATGDYGDLEASIGFKSAAVQAATPYATGVGGTSVALYGQGPNNNHFKFQTGWGNDYSFISDTGTPLDPPASGGFYLGAGGSASQYFAKPAWQKNLPGRFRQTPDVSAVADPFTGAEIVFTDNGQQGVSVIGGTSLACPFFSGIWAIANQKAGHPLGQAAPIIAHLPSYALYDIKPVGSSTNAAGTIYDSSGATFYSARNLVAPVETPAPFYSALWNLGGGTWAALSFGTDSSLETAPGWDNVTGYGSPNGLSFINAAARY